MLSIVKSKQVKKNRIAQEIKKLHLLKQKGLQEWEGNLIIRVKTSICLFVKDSCQQSYVLMLMLHNTEFTILTFEHQNSCTSFRIMIRIYDLYFSDSSKYCLDSIWCIVYEFVFMNIMIEQLY